MFEVDSSGFFTAPSLSMSETYSDITLLSSSENGFTELYRANKDGKQFVLKALKEEHRGVVLYEELLRKEYDLGYLLEHANIRRTYGFSRVEPLGSIVIMEYVAGRTLRDYFEEQGHSDAECRALILQLCEALTFAHKCQVIHRDLKPENIIITNNGDNLKIIDFGLSDSDSHISLKESAGTMRYASPELLRGEVVDNRSDIYSLGVIINELMPASRVVKRVVARCTMFDKRLRYRSAQAVAESLLPNYRQYIYWALGVLLLLTLSHLLYRSSDSMSRSEYIESVNPSAVVDGVSESEFARRKDISTHFYEELNSRYCRMLEAMYRTDCTVEHLPDFDKIAERHAKMYRQMLDSAFVGIESSSLYKVALRNLTEHNDEMMRLLSYNFPNAFWANSEYVFGDAVDSLAVALRERATAPDYAANFAELSPTEQERERKRYDDEVLRYKIATTQEWVVAYRKSHGLEDIPAKLLNHYHSNIKE